MKHLRLGPRPSTWQCGEDVEKPDPYMIPPAPKCLARIYKERARWFSCDQSEPERSGWVEASFFKATKSMLWAQGFLLGDDLPVPCSLWWASCSRGYSLVSVWALGHISFRIWGSQSLELWLVVAGHRLSCPEACGVLVPQPGLEPVSPALAGRFSTAAPSEKFPKKDNKGGMVAPQGLTQLWDAGQLHWFCYFREKNGEVNDAFKPFLGIWFSWCLSTQTSRNW